MKITILGITFWASDKILYADDNVAKGYIQAIKLGKGLAKKVLR